jgi:GR25 family glycosyltransferase involved in LPS biosynthesis
MANHLGLLGIQFEFFDAIHGAALSQEERLRINPTQNMSSGALGCYLSHIEIYRRMVEDHIPIALILEDDAVVLREVKELLAKGCESLDFDYCFLGCDDRGDEGFVFFDDASGTRLAPRLTRYRLSSGPYCTHAYLVTLKGARKRLACAIPAKTAIDHYHYLPYRPDFYAVIPLVAYVNEQAALGSMSSMNWSAMQAWCRKYWWYYPVRDLLQLRSRMKAAERTTLATVPCGAWRPFRSAFRVLPPWGA